MARHAALVTRWSNALKILRPALIEAVKTDRMNRAQTLLNRLNKVLRNQRETNIKNGLNKSPFQDYTLDDVVLKVMFDIQIK